jgi:hypothetical protein
VGWAVERGGIVPSFPFPIFGKLNDVEFNHSLRQRGQRCSCFTAMGETTAIASLWARSSTVRCGAMSLCYLIAGTSFSSFA